MTEWEFLSEVVEKADAGILLDVNNIYVSSQNHNFNPYDYLNNIPHHRVGQIHIAGHSKFEKYILDTHDHPVLDPVWKMYAHATEADRPDGHAARMGRPDSDSFDEVHIDAYVIAVKRRDALRSEASNTRDGSAAFRGKARRAALPRPRRTHVAVHRHNNRLFYKRLDPAAFRILESLHGGRTLSRAIAAAGPKVRPAQVSAWFKSWMALGWFCEYGNKRRRSAS
jgi:hypothetical protein